MVSIFDVAKYILDKYGATSARKLQTLLFYCQAMSLVWDDVPLFDDDFEAWPRGAMCRNFFNACKGRFILDDSKFLDAYNADTSHLTVEQKKTIDAVVGGLIDYPPYRLRDMVKSEKPWQEARGGIISKDSMLDYYMDYWA